MARDRKRAKQRRERRSAAAGGRSGAPAQRAREAARSAPGQPADVTVDPDVPGALDHASGEADEFRAALARGADGAPAAEAAAEDELQEAEADVAEPAAAAPAVEEERDDGAAERTAARGERASGAPLPSGNRAVAFLRASWAELQRVQWPDRRQVTQATAVVLGFVAVAGAYLGLADVVAKEIVEFVL